jgi:hypothetical protein
MRLGCAVLVCSIWTGCACDDPPRGARCRAATDCSAGELCVDQRCVERTDGAVPGPTDGALRSDGGVCAAGCASGEECVAGACCAATSACGDRCCESGELCSFERCIAPGAACEDSAECSATEYCDYAAVGESAPDAGASCAGSTAPNGRCLPRPERCAAGGTPGVTCIEACELVPASVSFEAAVRYRWPDPFAESPGAPYPHDVMMTPIVVQLADDNCDGEVDERDVPDIVLTTFENGLYATTGTMHALTVRDGALIEAWSFGGIIGQMNLAGGDFHAAPGGEVVGCGTDGSVVAVSATGSELWRTPATTCWMPALADLDQDGDVEVIVEGGILDGETGALEHAYAAPLRSSFAVSDLDGDTRLDVITGFEAFRGDGTLLVSTGSAIGPSDRVGLPAVVDLDVDGRPEVVVVMAQTNEVAVWRYDPAAAGGYTVVRAPFDGAIDPGPPWAWTTGMGPVTAGDFDGDDRPDVAYTGFRGYVVLSGAKLVDAARPSTLTSDGVLLWSIPTREDNGSTGSALFDFDGDGRVEVLYNDTERLRILSGVDGSDLHTLCNTTGSVHEYPVVADVDGDGEANVVLVANSFSHMLAPAYPGGPTYTCDGAWQSGVRVLSSPDGSWVRAPRVWNQHTYHVTNVEESGRIPAIEAANWTVPGLNSFRQNRQPGSERSAADATVTLICLGGGMVRVTVRNLGEAPMPAGIEAAITRGATTELARVATTVVLYPAQSQSFDVMLTPDDLADVVRAAIVPSAMLRQCRDTNDTATLSCLD